MPDITLLRSNSIENAKQANSEHQQILDRTEIEPLTEALEEVANSSPRSWSPLATRPISVDTNLPADFVQQYNSSPADSAYFSPMMQDFVPQYQIYYQQFPLYPAQSFLFVPDSYHYSAPQMLTHEQVALDTLNQYNQNKFQIFENSFRSIFVHFLNYYNSNWDLIETRSPPEDRSRWMIHQYEGYPTHTCTACGFCIEKQPSKMNFWYSYDWPDQVGLICYKTYEKDCPRCSQRSLQPMWMPIEVNSAFEVLFKVVNLKIYGKKHLPQSHSRSQSKRSSRNSSRTTSASFDLH